MAITTPEKLVTGMLNKQKGFSLIEIMIVVVIIGITITFATLTFGNAGEKIACKKSAEKFVHFITLVQQQAVLSKKPISISLSEKGYQAIHPFQGVKKLTSSPLIKYHNFPKNVRVRLKIFDPNSKPKTIHIMIQASGECSAFDFFLGTKNEAFYRVQNLHGEILIKALTHA